MTYPTPTHRGRGCGPDSGPTEKVLELPEKGYSLSDKIAELVPGRWGRGRDHLKTKATWGREGEGPSLGDIMLLLVTAMPETRSTVGFPRDKMH